MIILHQAPRAWGCPNLSPFCTKVETWLRMAELDYELGAFSLGAAPKGKMPYIKDGDTLMGDSTLIIEHLKSSYGDPLDGALSDIQKAQGHALCRMLEESLYFVSVYSRWWEPASFAIVKDVVFAELPSFLRMIVAPIVRWKVKRSLLAQGMGRHSRDEIYGFGRRDISAAAAILGEGPFLFGDVPTSFDATLFAFVVGISLAPIETPLKEAMLSQPSLLAHRDRMAQRYFSDIMKAPE